MKIRNIITVLLLVIILASCAPVVRVVPTETAIPTATFTPEPTTTPTPAPIILDDFKPIMSGKGSHGNMTCLTNEGNLKDIEGVTISANFSQNGKALDRSIPAENIDEQICFENVDAKYTPDVPVIAEINVKAPKGMIIENEKQIADLGKYQIVPFMKWIFCENGLDKNVGQGFRDGHRQWDLTFSSAEYPNGIGTPICSPSNAKVLEYINHIPGKTGTITNLMMFDPDTGFAFNFGHFEYKNGLNDNIVAGDVLFIIDKTQSGSSYPHLHFGMWTTNIPPPAHDPTGSDENYWVNPFSKDPFNSGANLPTGLWLNPPQSVVDLFESGYFDNWTKVRYVPNLSH